MLLSERPEGPDSVKSVSLAELASPRPSLFRRTLRLARIALMAWGAISLGAIAGIAAYYLNGGSDAVLLVSENQAAPSPPIAEPRPERLAALVETADAPIDTAPPAVVMPEAMMFRIPEPIVEARVPRPRPEAPIITGSIGPPAYDPNYVAPARRPAFDPCAALRNLGSPFPFRVRCSQQSRVYAPPRQYYPQPYHPPYFVED